MPQATDKPKEKTADQAEDQGAEAGSGAEAALYAQQLTQLRALLQTLDEQLLNLRRMVLQLDELGAVKDGAVVLVPIANGIFTAGTLSKASDLFVNVGSDIVVKKSLEETKAMLAGQIGELEGYRQETLEGLAQAAALLEARGP